MLCLYKLYTLLSEGLPLSPQRLSQKSSLPLSQISHGIEQLKEIGLEVLNSHKGYYLRHPIESLRAEVIRSHLTPDANSFFDNLETRFILGSTQDYWIGESPLHNAAVFSEYQAKGRGRQERRWITPLGGQLACSLWWKPEEVACDLSGLSLAIGIAIAKSLNQHEYSDIQLKWPNDLMREGKKLGGILVDVLETGTSRHVVVGIGINLHISLAIKQTIDQPVTHLTDNPQILKQRNTLAASLLNGLVPSLRQFESEGFESFLKEWQTFDFLFGKPIEWKMGALTQSGIAEGVNTRGELQARKEGKVHSIGGGNISVKIMS